ncbi:hypothetical protein BT96DRAFT_997860 [Gymnopus androsaceus JB14]|uniref:Uncharacterized protein n=1 Tax=Gymnopus androsaceus JB14 TaxID=1447944 RepID=A0A6A4HBQ2_9AGAR|nr:hypothetical protein BT96DRAFT_997860 [Gymnopus androsaceus JB14]
MPVSMHIMLDVVVKNAITSAQSTAVDSANTGGDRKTASEKDEDDSEDEFTIVVEGPSDDEDAGIS